MLCACSAVQKPTTPAATQQSALTIPQVQATISADSGLPEGYDPAAEEDGAVLPNGSLAEYAGATPIALDPLDKPTPTPRPELSFSYVATAIDSMGLTFEIPGNWLMDDSQPGTVVFTDPVEYDNVHASVTVKLANVASSYKVDDIKAELRNELASLGQYNYNDWTTQEITARKTMGADGFYSDYRGVMNDGTIVRGRVQMALLASHHLLTIEYQAPGWFNSNYKTVFDHVRETIKPVSAE